MTRLSSPGLPLWFWSDLAAALATVVALGVVLVLLRLAARHCGLSPEGSRKALHVAMGCVCASFPWLFHSPWSVAATCLTSTLLLLLLRWHRDLRPTLGSVLYGVSRHSFGEVYFALAVILLFFLAGDEPALFLAPVLLLTLGDAVAALVGVAYGRTTYETRDTRKSWEGSIALFTISFLAVLVPVLLLTATGRLESLLVALLVALLAVMLEGLSWRGLDNLVLPLGAFALLWLLQETSPEALALHIVVTAGLCLLASLSARTARLRTDGAMAAVLVAVFAWIVGGEIWLIPPLVLYGAHTLHQARLAQKHPSGEPNRQRDSDASDVLPIALTTLPWLVAQQMGLGSNAYFPFAVAFGSHLLLILLAIPRAVRPDPDHRYRSETGAGYSSSPGPGDGIATAVGIWALMALPSLIAFSFSSIALALAASGLALAVPLGLAAARLTRRAALKGHVVPRTAIAMGASIGALLCLDVIVPGPALTILLP